MALTPDEISELKSQLREQIQHLPPEKKALAEAQIQSMSPEALESMLSQQQTKQKPIFRMIADQDIPSKIIDENKLALAVLDIKPISPGHTIIIPKDPAHSTKDLPSQCLIFAKKISSRLCLKLKVNKCEIQTEEKFGEIIINIIPIYDKPLSINSPRIDTSEDKLESLYQLLRLVKKQRIPKIKKKVSQDKILTLPRRIP